MAGRKRLRQERGEERRGEERERVGVTVSHHGLDHQPDHQTSHPAHLVIYYQAEINLPPVVQGLTFFCPIITIQEGDNMTSPIHFVIM